MTYQAGRTKSKFRKRYAAGVAILAAALLSGVPPARAIDFPAVQISRPGDLDMNCAALSREAGAMRDLVSMARAVEQDATLRSRGMGAAGTVASYLVGTLTGTIGIMAAGHILREATDDESENAQLLEDTAKQRRSFLIALYNARSCQGPLQELPAERDDLLDMATLAPAAGDEQPRQTVYHHND